MLESIAYWLEKTKLPPEFQKPYFRAYVRALGAILDDYGRQFTLAVKSRFPSFAHDTVLAVIGEERQLPRGAAESRASYAARLVAAWETWAFAGTAYGILRQLDAVGYSGAKIAIVNSVLYSLDSNKELVVTPLAASSYSTRPLRPRYEGGTVVGYWSEFDVILGPPYPAGFSLNPRVDAAVSTPTQIVNTNGVPAPTLSLYRVVPLTTAIPVRVQVRSSHGAKSYWYSLNNGFSWSPTIRMLDDSNTPVTHILISAAGDYLGLKLSGWSNAASYVAGDEWQWTTTPLVESSFTPGDTSSEANLVRYLLKTWKPSHSICNRIVLYESGQLWGYPARTWTEANAAGVVWGDAAVAYWTGVA